MDNYERLIERVSQQAGITKDEVARKIEAKRAKLSGLVSKEGAAQIVAAELGINFEEEKMKIAELIEGMKKASVIGKIVALYPVRSYEKNGRSGKVANMILGDESGTVKTVFWDINHIALIEQNKIKQGDVLEVSRASVRNGELHLSSFSDVKLSKNTIDQVVTSKPTVQAKELKDAKQGDRIRTRAVIVQVFDPRYFEVCPECRKKAIDGECAVHGKIQPVRRALLNIVIDDGTETTRGLISDKELYAFGVSEAELFSLEAFHVKKQELLGEELYFSGTLKMNQLFNNLEFSIDSIEPVNLDKLLKELQA
jgi:ssDNA-binding replication factor A large subunit